MEYVLFTETWENDYTVWHYFLQYTHNEIELKGLYGLLNIAEQANFNPNQSAFHLDLTPVSEDTALQMCKIKQDQRWGKFVTLCRGTVILPPMINIKTDHTKDVPMLNKYFRRGKITEYYVTHREVYETD